MNDNHDPPFGFDTLTLDAVIVRDAEDNPPSRQALTMGLGADILTIPAILVRPGGDPPAGDWLKCGVVRLPRKRRQAGLGVTSGASDNTPSPDEAETGWPRPETRFYHPRGLPPVPSSAPDPIISGAAQWQRMDVRDVAAERTQTAGPAARRSRSPRRPIYGNIWQRIAGANRGPSAGSRLRDWRQQWRSGTHRPDTLSGFPHIGRSLEIVLGSSTRSTSTLHQRTNPATMPYCGRSSEDTLSVLYHAAPLRL